MAGNTTESSPILNFIFPLNTKLPPTAQVNLDAAHTNTFYVVNTIHDLTYRCIVFYRRAEEIPLNILLDMVSQRLRLTSRPTIMERVDWETTV
jgi:hypothetical protein